MSTRRILALAACSLFLAACNMQASVTPPAEEGTTEEAMEAETPTEETGDAMEAEVEAEVEAEAAMEEEAAQ